MVEDKILNDALWNADKILKVYKGDFLVEIQGKIPFDTILQLAQLNTLLEINEKLDKLNK